LEGHAAGGGAAAGAFDGFPRDRVLGPEGVQIPSTNSGNVAIARRGTDTGAETDTEAQRRKQTIQIQ
jgi:hypothetical protein